MNTTLRRVVEVDGDLANGTQHPGRNKEQEDPVQHQHRRTGAADTRQDGPMDLALLLTEFRDGDEHGWDVEFEYLRTHHGSKIRDLIGSVLRTGIRRPILIGDDGRVWDGHHRLYAAHTLGFKQVPVEYAR